MIIGILYIYHVLIIMYMYIYAQYNVVAVGEACYGVLWFIKLRFNQVTGIYGKCAVIVVVVVVVV